MIFLQWKKRLGCKVESCNCTKRRRLSPLLEKGVFPFALRGETGLPTRLCRDGRLPTNKTNETENITQQSSGRNYLPINNHPRSIARLRQIPVKSGPEAAIGPIVSEPNLRTVF